LVLTLPALNPTEVATGGTITGEKFLETADDVIGTGNYATLGKARLYAESGKEFHNRWRGARYCDEVGHAVIDKIDLVIGGTTIDSHYGHYLHVWNELTQTPEKKEIERLVGRSGSDEELQELAKSDQTLYVPLQFFFCRHLVQSLPLIALQYHEVKIEVKFHELKTVVADTGLRTVWDPSATPPQYVPASRVNVDRIQADHNADNSIPAPDITGNDKYLQKRSIQEIQKMWTEKSGAKGLDAKLLCNLVYLEEEERRTFAGSTHEYLVDLLQFQGEIEVSGQQTTYHAYFNHPTSELIWTIVSNAAIQASEPFNYSALDSSYNFMGDTLISAKLQFNGYDRFQEQSATYFRELIPSQYHTSVPTRPIYVYSFALEPEDFRPSGSVNLSRVDNVKLIVNHVPFDRDIQVPTQGAANDNEHGALVAAQGVAHPNDPFNAVKGAKLRVYARSKNVLRIKSGMAGLAYAN
jgi:hypothetical protein